MKIEVTGRNMRVTGAMRTYVEEKTSKLARHDEGIGRIQVVLTAEKERQTKRQVVEIMVHGRKGVMFIAEVEREDMYAAVDVAVDKLQRQLRRHKGKKRVSRRSRSEPDPV